MQKIAIVDYGMGNYHSVARALQHAAPEADVKLCQSAREIDAADRVVFPGQGAMADCVRTLDEAGLRESVVRALNSKPLLGICVGEQMLFDRSEEGNTESLGFFKGVVQRFSGPDFGLNDEQSTDRLKVPHMGWNPVRQVREHALWAGIPDMTPFYFVHSYHFVPRSPGSIIGQTPYCDKFVSAINEGNIWGVQFHPESILTKEGMKIFNNFLKL